MWNLLTGLRAGVRAIPTFLLAWIGRTNSGRWTSEISLSSDWDERTQILASLVPEASTVLEFGAGKRALEQYIHPSCSYTASDIVDRGPGTVVCNLNDRPLPSLPPANVVVFGGVLEYLLDPATVLKHVAASADVVILTYATKDVFGSVVWRRSLGWVNDYSEQQLEDYLGDLGFTAQVKLRWHGQLVCKFERVTTNQRMVQKERMQRTCSRI